MKSYSKHFYTILIIIGAYIALWVLGYGFAQLIMDPRNSRPTKDIEAMLISTVLFPALGLLASGLIGGVVALFKLIYDMVFEYVQTKLTVQKIKEEHIVGKDVKIRGTLVTSTSTRDPIGIDTEVEDMTEDPEEEPLPPVPRDVYELHLSESLSKRPLREEQTKPASRTFAAEDYFDRIFTTRKPQIKIPQEVINGVMDAKVEIVKKNRRPKRSEILDA